MVPRPPFPQLLFPSLRLLALAALLPALPAAAVVTFTDVTVAAGVDYVQYDESFPITGPDYMTGGVAVGDYDGDGWPDIYVTRFHDHDLLFRNLGNGTFDDVTDQTGLDAFVLRSNGAAWGDLDEDGDLDLYVTTHDTTRFFLFINQGNGTFTEEAVTRGASISGPDNHLGFSVTFGDYDLDGFVDIHTNEWRKDDFNPTQALSNARLLRNVGAANPGHFTDETQAAGVAMDGVPLIFGELGTTPFTSRFSDLDGDGYVDLAVAADFGSSRLFWNDGDGTFSDGTAAAGVGGDENGMGSAIGDYDGDGLLDWFVTSIYDPLDQCQCSNGLTGNRLYRNLGGRTFADVTDTVGVRDGGWGWGAGFLDFDNDGDSDLVMNNGQDWPAPYIPGADFFNADVPRVWRNDAGAMTDIAGSAGITLQGSGKGFACLDYDGDGDLDLFFVTTAGNPALYRNDGGNANDWLRVELAGSVSNRLGIGVRVEVQVVQGGPVQVREIQAGSHFLGQSELTAHFGLGPSAPSTVYRVAATFPVSGRTKELYAVSKNQLVVISEKATPRCGLIGIEAVAALLLAPLLLRRRR